MANKNIEIFMPYTKGDYIPKGEIFKAVLVENKICDDGANVITLDQTYQKMSQKYGDFVVHHYALNNSSADYIGFIPRNRYFNFSKKKFETTNWNDVWFEKISDDVMKLLENNEDQMLNVLKDVDLVAPVSSKLGSSVYEEYKSNYGHHIEDFDAAISIIREHYPQMMKAVESYCNSKHGYYGGMLIMKNDLFKKYANWMFDILNKIDDLRTNEEYNKIEAKYKSNLAERLTGIFFECCKLDSKLKVKELQRAYFEDVKAKGVVTPVFEKADCAVVMSANDGYAPYLSVAIQSIIENSNDAKNYDIVVMTKDISESNQKIIKSQVQNHKNISVRFCDVMEHIKAYPNLPIHGQISVETYFRYFIPDIFASYEKLLYLDIDLVCDADIEKLYSENIDGYLLGATYDIDAIGCYCGHVPARKSYVDKELMLKDPYKYFQAGVMLLNLTEFRKAFTTKQLLEFSMLKHWEFLDQDVLNHFCQGRVKILDMSWDAMMNNAGIRMQIAIKAPLEMYEDYLKARENPKIIHYAGWEKPWNIPTLDMGDYFWKYARLSPYYEYILLCMQKYQINAKGEIVNNYPIEPPMNNFKLFFKVKREEGLKTALKRTFKTVFGLKKKK